MAVSQALLFLPYYTQLKFGGQTCNHIFQPFFDVTSTVRTSIFMYFINSHSIKGCIVSIIMNKKLANIEGWFISFPFMFTL
jgi:hypothetical protein